MPDDKTAPENMPDDKTAPEITPEVRNLVAAKLEAIAEGIRKGQIVRLMAIWDGTSGRLDGEMVGDLAAMRNEPIQQAAAPEEADHDANLCPCPVHQGGVGGHRN